MKAKEVLNLLNITRPTLCSYVKKGIIKATKVEGSYYQYDKDSVLKLLGIKKQQNDKINVIYARTSNPPKSYVEEQAQRVLNYCRNLDNQIDNCIQKIGIVRYSAFKDTGSDLSFAVA